MSSWLVVSQGYRADAAAVSIPSYSALPELFSSASVFTIVFRGKYKNMTVNGFQRESAQTAPHPGADHNNWTIGDGIDHRSNHQATK
jgi:hypothetical protein